MENNKVLVHAPAKCGTICYPKGVSHQLANESLLSQIKIFFTKLFDTADWPARWHCGNWANFHGWLYIISDAAIWIAYFAIPILLFRIISKRKDIPFPKILWLFIAFILLCGSTHLLDAIIFWWPAYRLNALIKFMTAIVSLFTVYALYKLLPMIYRLRTLDELEAEIIERKKAEEEVRLQQVSIRATEELMAKKDEFMSIASHELKTPITTVKASLQVLEKMVAKNENLADIAPFVHRSSKQINKLTSLIDELLDVTKIHAGKLELKKNEFNLMEMVIECVDQCRSADEKHLVDIRGDESLTLFADHERIDQVLCNFLTNAFKYSPANSQVEVHFERLANGRIRLSVSDQGIGIPEDNISHVFNRFFRVANTSQNYSGIGLGLYISSQIIKAHNGEIGVINNPLNGVTFWFII
ncbi:signal transduction histidine kinase [Mucilaginibacter gracilis]|uniref:histidine kinase n=1 Tax=Mucilaginibacter gracilis TaxID=423350 RepID=A0A495IUR9_9SPHI|nr:HAMP domain-containing sensor histidine kinase [Mucilaginibacter gracilis]RKR80312.1 signal transduction histidine kinase [Mucilaginibacter gracilis]